jgi:hypothetical protein
MYKIHNPTNTPKATCVKRLSNNAFIPFDPANTDYAEFKKAVMEGAELQDGDGNVMTAEAAQAFVRGLP